MYRLKKMFFKKISKQNPPEGTAVYLNLYVVRTVLIRVAVRTESEVCGSIIVPQ